MTLGMIKYHLLVLAREPLNIFFGFGLPFLQLFIFSGTMDAETRGEVMAGALPIFITVASMVLCFTDSALSHGYTRQIKFLRRLRMTPVKPLQYIFTGIASRVGVLLLFAASFIAVSVIFFDLSITDINWALFVGVLLLAFIMFYLIGMFVANALKNAKGSQSLTYVVFFGLLAIGGIFFPIEVMPDVLQTVARVLPPAYAITSLQSAWLGEGLFQGHYFIAMIASTLIFGALSIKFFKYE